MTTYYFQRCTVRALPDRGLVRCHLLGVGRGRWQQPIRHEEFVNLPLREHEPLPETIRRAVFASPHMWRVSLLKNLSEFDGKFYQPVREQVCTRDSAAGGIGSQVVRADVRSQPAG